MAEVVAGHVVNLADRSCSCDEMFYDTRPPDIDTLHEHSLHVEMELHNAGYGPVKAAMAKALKDAVDDFSVNLTVMSGPRIRAWLTARAAALEADQ